MSPNPLRNIPSVSELLKTPSLRSLVERINHGTLATAARTVLDELRSEVQTVASERTLPDVTELAERIANRLMENTPPRMRSLVNATGILFHPELGRPPLADSAIEAMAAVARGFVDESHRGGKKHICREELVERLLKSLTSAEGAMAVSSMAAATALVMAALGGEKGLGGIELDDKGELRVDGELVISRGHMVDFGGEYRISDMASTAGVWLNEIGSANFTRIADYAEAISGRTSAVLSVEDGRFAMRGFVGSPTLKEIVGVARSRKVPVIAHLDGGSLIDSGSLIDGGSLIDSGSLGLGGVTSVPGAVAAGADLVIFRGDRLLGGPQCGLIVGRRSLLERIERHALADTCRMDGPTSAALAATLQLYSNADRAKHSIPLLQLLSASADNLKNRAERLAPQLAACDAVESAVVTQGTASLSGQDAAINSLASWRIEIEPAKEYSEKTGGGPLTVERLGAKLLQGEPGLMAQIQGERLVLDLRSVIPWQDIELVAAFEAMDEEEEDHAL